MKSCAACPKTAPSATFTPPSNFSHSQPNVKKDRIGSIGWCMGGGYALDVALQEPTLAATVINYGHLATDAEALKKINAPILGLFGAPGSRHHPRRREEVRADLEQLGKKIDVTIYPDAGHAFENPNNKDGYRAADAADAWQRTVDFLAIKSEEIAVTDALARKRLPDAAFSRIVPYTPCKSTLFRL